MHYLEAQGVQVHALRVLDAVLVLVIIIVLVIAVIA